jgi:YesN/AraC family two-component response regulator
MDDYLSKPVRKHELIGIISKWAEEATKVSA